MTTNSYKLMGGLDPVAATEKIISKGGPLMKQAETRGYQAANSRGLLNSSMGVKAAQNAVYDVAVPLASQQVNAAANQGNQVSSFVTNLNSMHQNTVANIMANEKIDAKTRKSMLDAATTTLNTRMALVEKIFNVDLDWEIA